MDFLFNVPQLVATVGYLGIFTIIFLESGMVVGFFLPGDSLLFTAGILASQGHFSIVLLLIIIFVAAVAGDSAGYALGAKFGPKVFERKNAQSFKKSHLDSAKAYYSHYGPITIVMARFMPIVRAIVPLLAGVGKMQYSTFVTYNVLGGALWTLSVTLLGYFLGNSVPHIERYIVPIIIGIVVLSFIPAIVRIITNNLHKKA